jgi:signal transduction histidine kinase
MLASVDLPDWIPLPGAPIVWEGPAGLVRASDKVYNYGDPGVRFELSMPGASQYYPVRYQTRLSSRGNQWTQPELVPYVNTGQFMDGLHQLEIRAIDPFGRNGPAVAYAITVLPPWYRTSWFFAGLFLLLVLFCLAAYTLGTRHSRLRKLKLEAIVVERTQELLAAHEVKDRFIANLSHEIRNPLNGVIGLIGQLKEGIPVPRRSLNSLVNASGYLRSTVEDVLDFSKLDAGEVRVSLDEVNVGHLVDGVLGVYRHEAENKGLQLLDDIRVENGTCILTDGQKLQQIVGNLVSNAVKFTDSGKIAITVELQPGQGMDKVLKITVKDTGPGIPMEEQKKVFEKFYQGARNNRKTPGTGLGLALVSGYIETLQGRVHLESQSGMGSLFEVSLPVSLSDHQSSTAAAGNWGSKCLGIKVLLVEDLEYNLIVMEDLLKGLGCEVSSAADGAEGLELARSGRYSIVFLDWELPSLNGLEITTALRRDPGLSEGLAIIGMTAYATKADRQKCLDAGMDAFLTKPLKMLELRRVLDQFLPEKVALGEDFSVGESPKSSSAESLDRLIGGKGLLEEMSELSDWDLLKARWESSFEEQLDSLSAAIAGTDTKAVRKAAHKLLGVVRMIDCERLADAVLDLMTAAEADDLKGIQSEWTSLQALIDPFLEEYRCL